jgi:hypothetical protein
MDLEELTSTQQIEDLLGLYLRLYHGDWPLTDQNNEDFEELAYARATLLLVGLGFTIDKALDRLEEYELKVAIDPDGIFRLDLINTKVPKDEGFTIRVTETRES